MHRRRMMALTLTLPFWAAPAIARPAAICNIGGVALHGHDPVAYFADGRSVRGDHRHALKWAGVLWYFASEENRGAFEMNPRRYAPQYGGYSAYAMAEGRLTPGEPEAWTLHAGKLYLNASLAERALWQQNVAVYVARADRFWPEVRKG